MLDQVLAQNVAVSHKVAQSTSSISSSLLLRVLQQLHQEHNTRSQVLIKNVVVEASIAHCKASKLPRVLVRILAALDRCGNQAMLQQLFVEETSVTAQVTNQVANLGANAGVRVLNQCLDVVINVRVVNRLIEILIDTSQLADQAQCIDSQLLCVLIREQFVLGDDCETTTLDELLCEVLGALNGEHQARNQRNRDGDILHTEVAESI